MFAALVGCADSVQLVATSSDEKDSAAHCYIPSTKTAAIVYQTNNIVTRTDTSNAGMVWVKGGTFAMGAPDDKGMPNEYPQHTVSVDGFWMDQTEVTNKQFAEFVAATGYKTTAERPVDWELIKAQSPPGTPKPADSLLQPGSMVFVPTARPVALNDISQWWQWTPRANWRNPEGPGSSIKGKEAFPVVQISWEDAAAYCKWAGKRLPTEAEWEWAASSGGKNLYAWGNENIFSTAANTWQGTFPTQDTKEDGYRGVAPVKSYPANAFRLYEMSGNVWEWCSDWYDEAYYSGLAHASSKNPKGPASDANAYLKVIRGGSFLCNPSYCEGYRRSKRMYSSYDSGTSHIGFRCVKN